VQYLYDHHLFPEEQTVNCHHAVRAGLLLLAIIAAAAPAGAQAIPLRYQWKQGDVLTYRTVVKTTSNSTGAPSGPATFDQTMSQTLNITVAAVDPEGTATLWQVIEAVTLELNSPMGKVVYDSARPVGDDADPRVVSIAKTVGGLVGERISVTMSGTGAVRRIDGAARIVEKLMTNLPRDPMAGGLAQNIRSMLSDDALRTSLEQSFSRMPEQPVKVGDTWTSEQAVGADVIGKIIGKSTFTLKAIEGSGETAMARIGVRLALRQENVASSGAASMRLDPGSEGEGEVVFNIARGRIEKNSMTTLLPTTVTMRGPEAGAVTIRNNTKTSMTMDITRRQ
jgi:hypothetical protein